MTETATPPRRRRFQIGLVRLLVAIALFAVAVAAWVHAGVGKVTLQQYDHRFVFRLLALGLGWTAVAVLMRSDKVTFVLVTVIVAVVSVPIIVSVGMLIWPLP